MLHSFGHLGRHFTTASNNVGPLARRVWVNEKILEILTHRDINIIRNLKDLARFYNDFKKLMLPGNKVSRI